MKVQIDKYKISGKVYIWAYKDNNQNYPGWNLTVDLKASEKIAELLNLMNSCEWSTKKSISTDLPTESQLNVPNNQNGKAKWNSKPKLTLNFRTSELKSHWLIKKHDNEIEIQFGKEKLIELQKAINGIPNGEGDFAITDENAENVLYFWWNL